MAGGSRGNASILLEAKSHKILSWSPVRVTIRGFKDAIPTAQGWGRPGAVPIAHVLLPHIGPLCPWMVALLQDVPGAGDDAVRAHLLQGVPRALPGPPAQLPPLQAEPERGEGTGLHARSVPGDGGRWDTGGTQEAGDRQDAHMLAAAWPSGVSSTCA